MSTKLYVGNLSFSLTEEKLAEIFAQAGNVVSAEILMDRQTGRSKGFAFVEMETEEDAKNAIQMFNGKDIEGRPAVVDIARPKRDDRDR